VFTLPICSRNFPTFASSPPGSEVNVMNPSSTSTPSGANEKKKSARVRIDDGLEARFRFAHLERRARVDLVLAGGAREVADDGHVRVEDL
jgi:hypothetical protein